MRSVLIFPFFPALEEQWLVAQRRCRWHRGKPSEMWSASRTLPHKLALYVCVYVCMCLCLSVYICTFVCVCLWSQSKTYSGCASQARYLAPCWLSATVESPRLPTILWQRWCWPSVKLAIDLWPMKWGMTWQIWLLRIICQHKRTPSSWQNSLICKILFFFNPGPSAVKLSYFSKVRNWRSIKVCRRKFASGTRNGWSTTPPLLLHLLLHLPL